MHERVIWLYSEGDVATTGNFGKDGRSSMLGIGSWKTKAEANEDHIYGLRGLSDND
jgi:hypothetical protein